MVWDCKVDVPGIKITIRFGSTPQQQSHSFAPTVGRAMTHITNEGLVVRIPEPKNVSCHPGGDDCILGGGHNLYISILFLLFRMI